MPITTKKHKFNEQNISTYAPNEAGVYGLYDDFQVVIYYGMSESSIASRLKKHLSGDEGSCTKSAMYFNTELTSTPSYREDLLIDEHKSEHFGHRPKCNDVG